MKIAVMLEKDSVSPHFGGSARFCIYTIEDGKVVNKEYYDMPEHKPGLFPKTIKQAGAEIVIAGSMGENAKYIFDSVGIKYIIGVLGNADDVVQDYINGALKPDLELANKIHAHEEGSHHHDHEHHHHHEHKH